MTTVKNASTLPWDLSLRGAPDELVDAVGSRLREAGPVSPQCRVDHETLQAALEALPANSSARAFGMTLVKRMSTTGEAARASEYGLAASALAVAAAQLPSQKSAEQMIGDGLVETSSPQTSPHIVIQAHQGPVVAMQRIGFVIFTCGKDAKRWTPDLDNKGYWKAYEAKPIGDVSLMVKLGDQGWVATASSDRCLTVHTGRVQNSSRKFRSPIESLCTLPNNRIAAGLADGTIHIFSSSRARSPRSSRGTRPP